jgi:hypothetical protein
VLAGAGAATGRRDHPPARAARAARTTPRRPYYERDARAPSFVAWLLGILAVRDRGDGGYLIYQRSRSSSDGESAIAVVDVRRRQGTADASSKEQGFDVKVEPQSSDTDTGGHGSSARTPPGRAASRRIDVTLFVLDRQERVRADWSPPVVNDAIAR